MSYICDLFFIFSLDFIVINYITLLKQTHLFLYIFWNISYYFLIITYIRKMNNFPIANVQHQGVAELLLNFLPILAWRCLLKKRVLKYVYLKNEMFLMLQSSSAISNTPYLELSQCRTFYLVPSAFINFPYKSVRYLELSYLELSLCRRFFFDPFSHFWAVSYPLSWTFEWGLRMNHTVHLKHSNVSNCIDSTLSGSLFYFL